MGVVQKIEIHNTTQNKAVMTVIPRGARSAADLSAMAFVSFSVLTHWKR
jgi:hypothetical protein